ncbi:hypothetical protein EDC01DRAFT_635755 [Geopyxis carbonaria]|nr:hypothetical protein EDC01DRAFT_635755 [Geopyxis carbonaria]
MYGLATGVSGSRALAVHAPVPRCMCRYSAGASVRNRVMRERSTSLNMPGTPAALCCFTARLKRRRRWRELCFACWSSGSDPVGTAVAGLGCPDGMFRGGGAVRCGAVLNGKPRSGGQGYRTSTLVASRFRKLHKRLSCDCLYSMDVAELGGQEHGDGLSASGDIASMEVQEKGGGARNGGGGGDSDERDEGVERVPVRWRHGGGGKGGESVDAAERAEDDGDRGREKLGEGVGCTAYRRTMRWAQAVVRVREWFRSRALSVAAYGEEGLPVVPNTDELILRRGRGRCCG